MSAFIRRAVVLVLGIMFMSVGLAAQRGGGGRSGDVARPETPALFDSEELKIHIDAPEGALFYTEAAPGRYKDVLVKGRFLHVGTQQFRDVSVDAKSSPNMSEADLKGYMAILEANPPQAKLPGFKKVSLKMIKIGKQRDKDAIDFVYNAQQDGVPRTYRLVALVHNGTGITFTCSSLEPQFGGAETFLYNPLFANIEFR